MKAGAIYCTWHDPSPEGRARHLAQSSKGGKTKAYSALETAPSIADVLDVGALNLETAAGVRALLGGALRQLARLPLDVRIANALAAVATAQRGAVEATAHEERLAELERASGVA